MQGTLIFYETPRGIIRGVDQNRYDFTPSDWLSANPPAVGQTVDFLPDGPNARDVLAQDTVAMPNSGNPEPIATQQSAASQPRTEASKMIYNLPGMVAATLLFISLIPDYGQLGHKAYRLTEGGLGSLYYVVALALIGLMAYGAPWLGVVGGMVAALMCTALVLMGKESLFSVLGQASRAAEQRTDALSQFGLGQTGQAIQQAMPSLTNALAPGFYLHALALLTLIYFVLIHRYEVRTGLFSFALPNSPRQPQPLHPIQAAGVPPASVSPATTVSATMAYETDATYTVTSGAIPGSGSALGSSLNVPVPSKEQTSLFLQSFLSFDKMIAPTLITIAYYIGLVACLLVGAYSLLSGLFGDGYGKTIQIMYGLGLLIFGPVLIRLWAEFIIVIFKIHTRLKSLDDKTKDT